MTAYELRSACGTKVRGLSFTSLVLCLWSDAETIIIPAMIFSDKKHVIMNILWLSKLVRGQKSCSLTFYPYVGGAHQEPFIHMPGRLRSTSYFFILFFIFIFANSARISNKINCGYEALRRLHSSLSRKTLATTCFR